MERLEVLLDMRIFLILSYRSINLTEEFYKVLEDFFSKRGIELSYNNDGSIFWSKDGWKDIAENIK